MFDIIDQLVKINWLYEKVFWSELLRSLAYNQIRETDKNTLKQIYWYKDIDDVFQKKIQRSEFERLSKIIFRVSENVWAKNNK